MDKPKEREKPAGEDPNSSIEKTAIGRERESRCPKHRSEDRALADGNQTIDRKFLAKGVRNLK